MLYPSLVSTASIAKYLLALAAIWNEFSWHTSYKSSDCRQHRYVIFVLLPLGQSGILMALTIYSHTGKPRSPNSSLIWITGPLLFDSTCPSDTAQDLPASCNMKFPQIVRNHTDSSLMLSPCHQSDHLFRLFLDSPRFACCLGISSGYCHPFLFKESQSEQYSTSLFIACALYLASSYSSILNDSSCLMS